MPRVTTIGRLLLEDALPPELHHHLGTLDSKGVRALAAAIVEHKPNEYRQIFKKLSDISNQAGYESGGFSFGPEDMAIGPQAHAVREAFKARVGKILATPHKNSETRNSKIVQAALETMEPLQKAVYDESSAAKNPLAMQVISGAKGSPTNLRSLIAGDVLYLDSADQPIPYPVTHSFYEGLRPYEYLAAASGARKSIVTTKLGTAQGGWLAKRLNAAAHRLVVVGRDGTDEHGGVRGLPVHTTDPANEGALLGNDIAGYPRNTVLDRKILADLHRKGVDEILVRSPMVGGPADGGVYGNDVGIRERGTIAPRGDFVGLSAAQSMSEPLTQLLLGSKHSGGVAGSSRGQTGFPVIERLFAPSEEFPGGAVHSQNDGMVNDIREAPQGGKEVVIGGQEHYVEPDAEIHVKVGDKVEAGDQITDGIPNPEQLTNHKGIGESRRLFVKHLMDIGAKSGFKPERRNVELVTRGYIDHVHIDKEFGDNVPGDIVSYQSIEPDYEPRTDHKVLSPKAAVGQYLERPVLHYTIGTRVQPSHLPLLEKHGVKEIAVHPEPPPFTPVHLRTNDILSHDRDWGTQMLGSSLQSSLLKSTARGAVSDPTGTSFVPALAEGIHFGDPGTKTRGWEQKDLSKV